MTTLVLTQSNVRKVLTMELALAAVESAFAAHGRGEVLMPSKVYLDLKHLEGDFRAMPAYMEGAAGVKWVNCHPQNQARHGLPTVMGMYVLSDPSTALPLAVMDATVLTAFRTGAAAGVASKYLASERPKTIGFIGCGVQARYLHAAHRSVYGELTSLAADLSRASAERFAQEIGGRAVGIEEAANCDIVCTATPSKHPVVNHAWVRKGAHINAMGADAHGKQELDAQLLREGSVFVDDWDQASESGEVNVPLHERQITRDDIAGTLGGVVASRITGRRGTETTIFDSTGLAVQDVALARMVYEAARDQGVGVSVDFLS